jgi:hypothetical protein
MTSVSGGARVPHTQKEQPTSGTSSFAWGGIYSPKATLVEGSAAEFVPSLERATGMHGFAIMVPADEKDGWLLDMLWRVTMAYVGLPSLLRSQSNVRKMVEAVMSRENRPVDNAKPKRVRTSRAKPRRPPC